MPIQSPIHSPIHSMTGFARLQVRVHEIVAPAVELLRRRRRTVVEDEERPVEIVRVGEIDQRAARAGELFRRGAMKYAADVVIVVIDEEHAAAVDELFHPPPFFARKSEWQVSRQVDQRKIKESR